MRNLFAAAALCLAFAGPAFADDKVYVQLPDLSDYWKPGGMDLLYQLARAQTAITNCPGVSVTAAEASLLSDSADILMHLQDIDTAAYEAEYAEVALAQLDCSVDGPDVRDAIDELVGLGGSREALPDQAQAAKDYQAMLAERDAAAN